MLTNFERYVIFNTRVGVDYIFPAENAFDQGFKSLANIPAAFFADKCHNVLVEIQSLILGWHPRMCNAI